VHPRTSDFARYHINCKRGDLAEYLLVPGDPDRVPKIIALWDSAREISCHREFRSATGTFKGTPISALSSGIGPACMAIAVNESSEIGVSTFVRVGSTGVIQENISIGDVIICSGAVRLDGTSECYAMPEYPAYANHEVLLALIEAAELLGVNNYHVGVVATTADFYAGQNRRGKMGGTSCTRDLIQALRNGRVLSLEMETATLYTLASLYGLRAGSVCAVYGNRATDKFEEGAGEANAIGIANEAVKILHEWDAKKRSGNRQWLFPSLLR